MKHLRKLWFRIFKRYRRLELRFVRYSTADDLIRDSQFRPESERWQIAAAEEDKNPGYGFVYLERRERIWD